MRKIIDKIPDNYRDFLLAFGIILLLSIAKTVKGQDTTLTKDNVYNYIVESCIHHPDIVFQQALKESGHLKCEGCSLDHNNLFGFRYNHEYLEFDTWKESIDYYERWQIRKGYNGEEDYHEFLIRKWGAPKMREKYIPTLKDIGI